MDNEKAPPETSRRGFIKKLMGLAAMPMAGGTLGAAKQTIKNGGTPPEDLAMIEILNRVAKHRPEGLNPENALFVMGAYRDVMIAQGNESEATRKLAHDNVMDQIDKGMIVIAPDKAEDVLKKYETALANIRRKTTQDITTYGGIGLAASALAYGITVAARPSNEARAGDAEIALSGRGRES